MPMRQLLAALIASGLLASAGAAAHAASFDCRSATLTAAQITVCGDQELSQSDDRVARRVRDLQKRHGLGLYLGLRYWANRSLDIRDGCGDDRACLLASYRAQQRLLERLQACLDGSIRKRACLRTVIHHDETAQGGAPAPARARAQ